MMAIVSVVQQKIGEGSVHPIGKTKDIAKRGSVPIKLGIATTSLEYRLHLLLCGKNCQLCQLESVLLGRVLDWLGGFSVSATPVPF
mmetsp:Transcript_27953/g.42318  ORF Transcript_27953/g.42318 Transcript_27953/m.42318 type:complete len:86 (-) Transcript_27953:566-823(-)